MLSSVFRIKHVIVALSTLISVTAYAQMSEKTPCLKRSDIVEVAEHFEQLAPLLESDKENFCLSDSQIDETTYKIARATVALKNISPNEPNYNEDDAFTYQAISEKDWWSYYKERANRFSVDNNCPQFVVAYVHPFFPGIVHLCDPFFESNLLSQLSTLMHEARHFDGYAHVTCTRGNEEGTKGACDDTITERGSYAISVQTLVSMARSERFDANERTQTESRAIYTGYNKFNELPDFVMNEYLHLANDEGEVYEWLYNFESTSIDKVATLDSPAKIESGFSGITVYPLDAEKEAYRLDHGYNAEIESIGLYAELYNRLNVFERNNTTDVSYYTDGGILKGETFYSLCDGQNIVETDLSQYDRFTAMIGLRDSADPTSAKSHLVTEDGDIYSLKCPRPGPQVVDFEPTIEDTGVSIELEEGVEIVEGVEIGSEQFALLSTGEIARVELMGSNYVLAPADFNSENVWVGMASYTKPAVFEKELMSQDHLKKNHLF